MNSAQPLAGLNNWVKPAENASCFNVKPKKRDLVEVH